MSVNSNAEQLARQWINCWNEGTPDLIPLAEDFKHTSPFGCVEGRETYLEWVKPLAAKNVTELKVLRTIPGENQAAIHFEMKTPAGTIHVCDWVDTRNGEITQIHSFYDATDLKSAAASA